MPGNEFPKFPTQFTEEEASRLEKIKEQRKQMEQVYQSKFTQEAWSKVNPIEKAVRWWLPSFTAPLVKAVTPWQWGWEYGFTPEQAQEKRTDLEIEFKELAREEKVTRLLPVVLGSLEIAVLSGEPIESATDLVQRAFPSDMSQDFTDEEKEFISSYGRYILTVSKEDIISGKAMSEFMGEETKPLTIPDWAEYFKTATAEKLAPRYILSTVAFSTDIDMIKNALLSAFPPSVEETEKEGEEYQKQLDERLEYYKQWAIEQGIRPEEGDSISDLMRKAQEKIGSEEGQIITLSDDNGNIFVGKRMSDDRVFMVNPDTGAEELVGYYDEEKGIIPVSPSNGTPLREDIEQQNWFQENILNNLMTGARSIWSGLKGGFFASLREITSPPKTIEMEIGGEKREVKIGGEGFPGQDKLYENLNSWIDEREVAFRENEVAFYKNHPELAPKPEYQESPLDNKQLLKDPGYWFYMILNQAPQYMTAYGVGVGVGLSTKNVLAGSIAAASVIAPMEINSIYEELLRQGVDKQQAVELANTFGLLSGSIEILPGMVFLKIANPAFMRMFKKQVIKETINYATRNGFLGRMLGIGKDAAMVMGSEMLEEGAQEIVSNSAVKVINENQDLFENVTDTMIQTAISIIPLAGFGGFASYRNMKANLPPETQERMTKIENEAKAQGLEEDHANAIAVGKIMETEEGKAQVELAMEKANTTVDETSETPVNTQYAEKIRLSENKIEVIRGDIDTFQNSLDIQEERLSKLSPIEQEDTKEAIANLKGEIAGLKIDLKVENENLASLLKKSSESQKKEKKTTKKVTEHNLSESIIYYDTRDPEFTLDKIDKGMTKEGMSFSLKKKKVKTSEEKIVEARISPDAVVMNYEDTISSKTETKGKALSFKELRKSGVDVVLKGNEVIVLNPSVILKPETSEVTPNVEGIPSSDIPLKWDSMEEADRLSLIAETKVAKTASRLNWNDLNDIQKKLILKGAKEEKESSVNQIQQVVPEEMESYTDLDLRPKLEDFEVEQSKIEKSVQEESGISSLIKISNKIKEAKVRARVELESVLNQFKEYEDKEETDQVKEQKKNIKKRLRTIATQAGVRVKDIMGKGWDDFPPTAQAKLAVSFLPDRSIRMPGIYQYSDVKHYVRVMEEETGLPFYQLYPRLRMSHGAAERAAESTLEILKTSRALKGVRTNPESLRRVTQQINSKNPALNVEPVEDLSEEEIALVETVEDILKHYEPYVRYLRIVGTKPNIKDFRKEFPDAVEAGKEFELEFAIDSLSKGEYNKVWQLANQVTWGTITGYTPWMKAHVSIFPKQIRIGTTRGEARLMQRDSVDFDDTLGENLLLDVVRYVKQIESQWRLRNELESVEEYWKVAKDKFVNAEEITRKLQMWAKELQGLPPEEHSAGWIMRIWRQAMSALFMHPYMSFRNLHQALAFHPDRTELLRYFVDRMPASTKAKASVYYENFVHQLGGIRADFLMTDVQGFKFLDPLNRFADWLSLYARSDNIPRMWTFYSSVNKARRATETFMKSNKTVSDTKKWIVDSGAQHLTQTERNYALELLSVGDKNMNLAVPGLEDTTGYEYANFYIGNEVADMTHFIYRRAFRAISEMGTTGRILFNLSVFPRSYGQRVLLQLGKTKSLKNIFGEGDVKWEDVRAGFKDVVLLSIVGMFVSDWLNKVSGRPRRAYNTLQIFQWQIGGLAIGVVQDLAEAVGSVFAFLDAYTTGDEAYKEQSLGRFIGLLNRIPETLVPFWRIGFDSFEAAAGVEDVGLREAIKILRSKIDDKYKPDEIETMERNLWEKMRKAVLGGESPEDSTYQEILQKLKESEEKLYNNELDSMGRYYTLKSFGNELDSVTKPLPDDMLQKEYGFSDLEIFYFESRDSWKSLYELPSQPSNLRTDWRYNHIEEEASLLFWGKYTTSVWGVRKNEDKSLVLDENGEPVTIGKKGEIDDRGKEVYRLLNLWRAQYGLNSRQMPRADWAD